MRWAQTGYISEHMPEKDRSIAIGTSTTMSGIGAWTFMSLMRYIQTPGTSGFSSKLPFIIAAGLGSLGVLMLIYGARNGMLSENRTNKLKV